MTYSPAELELSPDAAARLEDYLRQVRAALAGTTDVYADEIEADIREHVENELRSAPRPISAPALEEVLTRLGPPSQWGTTDDPTLFRRARHLLSSAKANLAKQARGVSGILWRGPEDWRLPYLSFGIFVLGLITFFALFPITLIVSYFLSRAGIAYAKERGIELGTARKWLLYPPVVIVSGAFFIAVVAWPVIFVPLAFHEVEEARDHVAGVHGASPKQKEEDRKLLASVPVAPEWAPGVAGVFVGVGSLALWWTLLGVIGSAYPGAVRAVFYPLCNCLESRHSMWLAVGCAVVLIPWSFTTYEVVVALVSR